jgi:hypothetical protein
MDRTENFDAVLQDALQLACFIHGDKATAAEIAANALSKLEVAAQAQDKRLYYTPSGRSSSRVARTKVSLCEHHLLQRLLYIESEPFEKRKEEDGLSGEEDMIIHFIKHLMKITLKRNSFYVTLGVSRLLHNYSTAETMEIYNLVVQDPERVRDDYYYRSRKARLMAEMKERFGELVRAVRMNRGEERFESDHLANLHKPLVRECLARFTPWTTRCILPEKFDPTKEIIKGLSFDSKDPDAEHVIEVNRFHSVIHPDCYLRLSDALQLDTPANRLDIPHFFLSENAQRPPRNGKSANWGKDELDEIRKRLDEQRARRRSFSASLLRILVDGVEKATLDLRHTTRARFTAGRGAELLEVIGVNAKGELLLATRLFDEASLKSLKTTIRLEGGQEICFNLTPSFDSIGEVEETVVEVGYRETNLVRAAALVSRQRVARMKEALKALAVTGWAKPALAFALLALLAAGVWFFALRGNGMPNKPEQAHDKEQTPAPEEKRQEAPAPDPNQKINNPQQAKIPNPQPSSVPKQEEKKPQSAPRQSGKQGGQIAGTAKRKPRNVNLPRNRALSEQQPQEIIAAIPERLRGGSGRLAGLLLQEVKSIALDLQGDEELGRRMQEQLTLAFASSARFVLTERDNADALLKVFIKREPSGASFIVRLANDKLFVIFPTEPKTTGRKYKGSPDEVAAKILNDLLIESARQKK